MKCPMCQQVLEPSGEISDPADGRLLTVYQCDDCVRNATFDGAEFPVAMTFGVDADGRTFDPLSFDPLDLPRPGAEPSAN